VIGINDVSVFVNLEALFKRFLFLWIFLFLGLAGTEIIQRKGILVCVYHVMLFPFEAVFFPFSWTIKEVVYRHSIL